MWNHDLSRSKVPITPYSLIWYIEVFIGVGEQLHFISNLATGIECEF